MALNADYQIAPRISVSSRVFYRSTDRDDYRPTVPGSGVREINDSDDTNVLGGRVALRFTFNPYVF